ncbi:hypothetical protein pb186bvf_020511 [Paramecium bursaria]
MTIIELLLQFLLLFKINHMVNTNKSQVHLKLVTQYQKEQIVQIILFYSNPPKRIVGFGELVFALFTNL